MNRRLLCLAVVAGIFTAARGEAQARNSVSGIVLQAVVPDSAASNPDTFLGPDKVKHFMMSAFIETVGFSSLQAVGSTRDASIATATALTLGIGVARELHDRKANGLFSLGDLTWDALGTAAALLLISHTRR